jgi:arabinofuranosyltransferase
LETGGSVLALASWAGLAALARPDGLLFVGLTGLYGVWEARRAPKKILALAPLLLPLVHTLWRHGYYGMWLPNTYYAKHVAPWPEMGAAYVAAFILEYGYIVWLVVAAVAIVRVRRFALSSTALVVTGVFGHFLYYTAIIGGDHFEFRVYQPLVVALALSFAPLARTFLTPGRTFAALTLGLFLGLPIPWAHHALTRGATHYKQPESFIFPIAEHVPWPLSWYAQPWDALHRHLLSHFVGIRVEGHRTYLAHQVDRFPTREEGGKISGDGLPVLAHTSVGYPAWTMPTSRSSTSSASTTA